MAAHQISSGELRDYALIVECRRLAGCAAGFGQHLVGMFAEQRGEAPERRRRARETRRRDSYSRRERQVLAFHEAQASPARGRLGVPAATEDKVDGGEAQRIGVKNRRRGLRDYALLVERR
jgi:hypothetical protein